MKRRAWTDHQLLSALDVRPPVPPPAPPLRLRARGNLGTTDAHAIRAAQKARTYVRYQGRLYRVESFTRDATAGTFAAILMERRRR